MYISKDQTFCQIFRIKQFMQVCKSIPSLVDLDVHVTLIKYSQS